MIAPCKGCEKRYLGCHSKCEEYAEFKRQSAELHKRTQEIKQRYYGSVTLGKRKRQRRRNGYL